MNKKLLLLFIISLVSIATIAKEYAPYKIKAQFIGGYIYPSDKNLLEPIIKGPALGGEIAFEMATNGTKQWHKDFRNPEIGYALQVIDFHNPEIMGQMISVYPYLNIPLAKNDIVSFNVKIGGGLAFCTKPTDLEAALADPRSMKDKAAEYNFAIGGVVNFTIATGLNLDVKVHKNISLTADIMYNHYSSGNMTKPNTGLNLLNGYIGLKYMPIYKPLPEAKDTSLELKKRWCGDIIAGGGFKKLYYKDNTTFGAASLSLNGYYKTCRQHRIGLGVDLFYDGAYAQTVEQDASGVYHWTDEYTYFKRTCTTNNDFSNKLRLGVNIANELTLGKFAVYLHWGIYLYDPIKNMEPGDEVFDALNKGETPKQKGIFYGYDINKEDGWNYFKIGAKYDIYKGLLVNLGFKIHLQKVEFVQLGIGYAF